MEAKLVIVSGKANRRVVDLKLPTIIGRSCEAHLTVAHPMISRHHCELFEQNGLLMVRDLESLNGTLVKGKRIKDAPLRPNDEFTIGPLTFRAEYEFAGDISAAPAPHFADSVVEDKAFVEIEITEDRPPFDSAVMRLPDLTFMEESSAEHVTETPPADPQGASHLKGSGIAIVTANAAGAVKKSIEVEDTDPGDQNPVEEGNIQEPVVDGELQQIAETGAEATENAQPEDPSSFLSALETETESSPSDKNDNDLDEFLKKME